MRCVRLDPKAYRRTPWKNGGGVTVDVADDYAPGAAPGSWSGMLWRLGHTRILAPAPFSDLAGFDRILTVIGGRGLVLQIEGGAALDVREPFRPVRFRGEDRIVSRLEAGPVTVLNLLADRTKYAIDVLILSGGDDAAARCGDQRRLCARGQRGHDRWKPTRLHPTKRCASTGRGARWRLQSGRVALAKISSRSAP